MLLVGLAVTFLGVLAAALHEAPLTRITPDQAPQFEGQQVTVAGVVTDVRPGPSGTTWFTLAAQGTTLDGHLDRPLAAPRGSWMEANGDLKRVRGNLVIFADQVRFTAHPEVASPSWSQMAAEPDGWSNRLIRIEGTVEGRFLHGDGHSLRLGDGNWPREGAVRAVGVLAYEPVCLCHRLHADRVESPWNS